MRKTSILTCVLLLAGATLAHGQSAPTREEQAACRADAMKLCSAHIGKPTEMNACLKANKPNLSAPCKKVIESRGG